jgi:hypothetical protein
MIKRMIKEPSDRIDAKASKGVPRLTNDQAHPTENRMPRQATTFSSSRSPLHRCCRRTRAGRVAGP